MVPPAPALAATAQGATSPGGLIAEGYVPDARFPDGSTRWLSVTLVVPAGPVVSSGPTDSVDLAKPWAVLTETSVESGARVCGRVENPTTFNPGGLRQAGDGEAWHGTSVDVRCDDGAGYQFYRVRWDPGMHWLVRNPFTTQWSEGHVSWWSAPPLRGSVQAWPAANQQAGFVVCGYRSATVQPSEADCFGQRSGYGAVIPETTRITSDAVAVAVAVPAA
jgi:hypothetical protein